MRYFSHFRRFHFHMKALAFSLLLLIPLARTASADPDPAPFINNQIKQLNKSIDADLAAGTLTQADADELKRQVKHVQAVEDSEPSLTPKTRRDLREDLSKISKDLERKEEAAKATGSASPSPTP